MQSHKRAHMPRVCIVTESFYPPAIGGQQKQLHDLGAKLVAKGVQVMVVARQTYPPAAEREVVGSMKVIRVAPGGLLSGQGWQAVWPLVVFLWNLFATLIRERQTYDLLLVSGLKVLPLPTILISRLLGKFCVIRSESPIELWQELSEESLARMGLRHDSALPSIIRTLRYALVKRADGLIAISSQLKTAFLQAGIHSTRIELLPNGIDTTLYSPADPSEKAALRTALGLPADKVVFIFTGRLTSSKGLPELMDAWRTLASNHADIHLLLVGSGAGSMDDAEGQVRRMVDQYHLQRCVTLAGAVDNVQDYLRASDVFVFPSHYEGFGLSIVEAMACGLPVIVTSVGVALEIVQPEQNGLLVPVRDTQQLSAAIEWMLAHRAAWPAMGDQARTDVYTRYSMDVIAGQYVTLFYSLRKSHLSHFLHSPFAPGGRP